MRSLVSGTARRLQDLGLRTKLLLTMLSLLVLSISSLFVLHLLSERQLISQVGAYTEDLSTTIQIAQEQPTTVGDPKDVLKAYAEKLTQLGVKDVSVADAADEVQASTNPQNVGKRLVRVAKKRGKEWVIRGVLGEESGPPGSQRTSTLTIPIVVGDRRVGYLLITRILDDFSALAKSALVTRVFATFGVFAVGMLLSLFLSSSFSRPIQDLTQAAQRVAAGDLAAAVPPGGGDEMGSLTRAFNEMVERLRENKRLEERLHFAERSTAMGRLASAVAHEIRNPLNFINLSIDHVRGKLAPEDGARRESFDTILGNVKSEISRLNRLVGDFLSFGKPMRLDSRPCAVDRIVRDVAALVDHKARDQGIVLNVKGEPGLPEVVADAELLKTCFLNLMINAVDAMPGGGFLSASIRRVGTDLGDAIQVSIVDTGYGMTVEEVDTAFEPYFSTKDTGLGLGLALTRKIVEDHGGTIQLESVRGQGTTARISIPLAPRPAEERVRETVTS